MFAETSALLPSSLRAVTLSRRFSRTTRSSGSLPSRLGAAAIGSWLCLAVVDPTDLAAQLSAEAAPDGPPRVTLDLPNGARPVPPGPYTADWSSLAQHRGAPEWMHEAKFGVFVFWGLFNVPDHRSDWYPRNMYSHEQQSGWHAANFGPQDQFGYKDFIPLFKAKRFDPAAMTELFERAGVGYVVGLAEFRDGFALYDSALTRWDVADMGPKRDLLGELRDAARARGLKFGVSYMRMSHWSFMFPRLVRLRHDLFDPAYAEFYGPPQRPGTEPSAEFQEEWLLRVQELIDKYEPDAVMFDSTLNARALDPLKARVAAYYYNRAAEARREVTLCTTTGGDGPAFPSGAVREFERQARAPKELTEDFWQVVDPLTERFGYVTGANTASASIVVRRLVENVCRNGSFLLVVSPRADGSIPDEQQEVLRAVGGWMSVNSEAIRGTRPWNIVGEGTLTLAQGQSYSGRDIRFTRKKDALYAIALSWPGTEMVVASLPAGGPAGTVTEVRMLGSSEPLEFSQDSSGLKVKMPEEPPCAFAFSLKIAGLNLP